MKKNPDILDSSTPKWHFFYEEQVSQNIDNLFSY